MIKYQNKYVYSNKKKKKKTILNIKCSNKRKCFITVDRLFKTRLCTYDRGVNTWKKEIKNILIFDDIKWNKICFTLF